MGQSLNVYVFYGMQLPNSESAAPRPQLNDLAIEKLKSIGREVTDRSDWSWELEKLYPQLDILHVGVSDYTTAHIAIKDTVKRDWDGDLIPLPELKVDLIWEATIQEALKCLRWVEVDYDDDNNEVYKEVDPPELKVGWWAGANWG